MVTLVILNHNGAEVLEDAITCAKWQNAKVVVLDNASQDNSVALAQAEHVEVWHADNQHQFITGLNTAFTLAQTSWVLFQQEDIRLDPACLEKLLEAAEAHGARAIYQPVLYNVDGSINHAGGEYLWPGVGRGYQEVHDAVRPYRVPLFATACFLMHQHIFRRLGEFDVQLAPAYYEDVDYSLRAEQAGIPRYVVPQATGTHLSTFTFHRTHSTDLLSAICRKNRRYVVRKHYRGLDQLSRIAALHVADTISCGLAHLHGDTYRPPSRRNVGGPLGLA